MSPDLYQQIQAQGGAVDLSDRAKFLLTGGDRIRYLNGQVTNDVRPASERETLYACVTDLKGRIVGDVFIHGKGDALLLDAEADLRDVLGPRLERYIIADDAVLTDVTEERLWHVFGPAAAGFSPGLKSTRLGIAGIDLWMAAESPAPELSCPILSAEDFETFRILRGIPRYPHELNTDTFPPEAGLDERGMSYTKGCYIGQEILSRIKTTGKMPRTLVQKISSTPVAQGAEWRVEDKVVGHVTSVAQHPVDGTYVCLGYVKQGTDVAKL